MRVARKRNFTTSAHHSLTVPFDAAMNVLLEIIAVIKYNTMHLLRVLREGLSSLVTEPSASRPALL